MLHTRGAISFRGGRRVFHSAVLAALTMAAMLLCLLAVHSAGTGHGLGHGAGPSRSAASAATETTATAPPATATATATATALTVGAHSATGHSAASATPVSTSQPGALAGPVLERIAPATTAVVALAAGTLSSADTHAMSDLAALSMTCSLLLILGGLILLSRRPSSCRRLLEAGGFIVGSFREIPLHLHRPSLTLLSISRI